MSVQTSPETSPKKKQWFDLPNKLAASISAPIKWRRFNATVLAVAALAESYDIRGVFPSWWLYVWRRPANPPPPHGAGWRTHRPHADTAWCIQTRNPAMGQEFDSRVHGALQGFHL